MTSVFVALANAADKGGEQVMRLPTYRRLNLGLALASLGLCGAAVQPWLSGGAVACASGGYPWLVPPTLRLWSAGAFASTTLLCVSTWAKSVESRGILTRPARGAVGSLWALVPLPRQGGALDDPEKSDDRAEYAFIATCFFAAAFWPFTQGFPDAGAFLGRRGESAFVAGLAAAPALFFTLLGGVVAYTLKDAAERGRLGDDTYVTLRRGLGLGSGLHLALCFGRLFGTELSTRAGLHMFFPGALAALSVGSASLMVHAVALFVACTPPPSAGYNAQQFGPYQNEQRGGEYSTGGGGLVPYRAAPAPFREDFAPRGRPQMSSGGEGYPASNRRMEMIQGEFAEGASSNVVNEFTPSSRRANVPGGRDRSAVAPDSRQWPFFSQS